MRIVVDARSVAARRSGIGRYVENLLRHLVPMAGDTRFLFLRHPTATGPLVRDERCSELRWRGETKSIHTALSLAVLHDFGAFDLYHSPGDIVPLGLGCPWLVTIHDLMWVEAPGLGADFLPTRLANAAWYRWNLSRSIRGAERVVAVSRSTARALGRIYPDCSEKVDVIHHGVDVHRFSRSVPREASREAEALGRYSLVIGQGSPYKNHAGMIEAFVEATRDEPEHRLVLVRRFVRIDSGMRRLLRRRDVRNKVVLRSHVTDDALLGLYRHARSLLFVSHCEGFGMPLLEAMAASLPVLASRAPAVLEITADAALHAESTSHSEIVSAIRRIEHDELLRRRLVERGRRRVLCFTWQDCAARTLSAYRAAVSRRVAGRERGLFNSSSRPEPMASVPARLRS